MTLPKTIQALNKRTDEVISFILQGNKMSYDSILYNLNYNLLIDGLTGVDPETLASIKANLATMTEKKVKKMFVEINAIDIEELFDDRGKGIKSRYNDSYIKAEKQMTKRKVREIKQWTNYSKSPGSTLTWQTANDERVRHSHKQLDGLTLPANHTFWKNTTPASFYNCRCTLKQNFREEKITKSIPNVTPDQPGNTYYDGTIFDVDKLYN